MFSGIIERKSKILKAQTGHFEIEHSYKKWEIQLGQSIAHDGACMTLTEIWDRSYSFFMMEESLSKTHFSERKAWDYLNIERCLKVSDRIDGHFVSGHIDTTWELTFLERKDDNSLILWVSFDEKYSKYTIEKWSITLNWVSLTIVEIKAWYISVSLIPLTQDWTNLWDLNIWDILNIEFDLLWKYILNR